MEQLLRLDGGPEEWATTPTTPNTKTGDTADLVDKVAAVSLDLAAICHANSRDLPSDARRALHDANELLHFVISELVDIVHGSDEIAPVHAQAVRSRRVG